LAGAWMLHVFGDERG